MDSQLHQYLKLEKLLSKVIESRRINKSLDHSSLVGHLKVLRREFPKQFSESLRNELENAHSNNKYQNKRVKKLFNELYPGKTY